MKKKNSNSEDYRTVARHFNEWLKYEREAKSCHTIAGYKLALRLFIRDYLETELKLVGASFDISKAFAPDTISKWLLWLKNRGCQAQTINHRRTSLLCFLKYLGKREPHFMTFFLEAKDVQKHKVKPVKVHGFSLHALKAILNVPNTLTKTGYRDCVLMSLLYATGARINEILSLRLRDIKQPTNQDEFASIIFYGKGNKYRSVPLLKPSIEQLQKYITIFHGKNASIDELLFYSKSKGVMAPLSQRAINYRLRKYALEAHKICDDVPLDVHSHQFRHTRATQWIKEGHPLAVVSSLLGHASLETTMAYLDITPDMIAEATKNVSCEQANSIQPKWNANNISNLFDFD